MFGKGFPPPVYLNLLHSTRFFGTISMRHDFSYVLIKQETSLVRMGNGFPADEMLAWETDVCMLGRWISSRVCSCVLEWEIDVLQM